MNFSNKLFNIEINLIKKFSWDENLKQKVNSKTLGQFYLSRSYLKYISNTKNIHQILILGKFKPQYTVYIFLNQLNKFSLTHFFLVNRHVSAK